MSERRALRVEQLRADAEAHVRIVLDRLVAIAAAGTIVMQVFALSAGAEHPLAMIPSAAAIACAVAGIRGRARWTPYAYIAAFYVAIVVVMATTGPMLQLGALAVAASTLAFLFVRRTLRPVVLAVLATAPLVAGILVSVADMPPPVVVLGSIHTWGPSLTVAVFGVVCTALIVRASIRQMRLAQREMARALDEERAARRERERLEGHIGNARRVDLIVALAAEVGKDIGGALATISARAEELAAELTRDDARACLADVLATAATAGSAMSSLTALDAELAAPATGADAGRTLDDLPRVVRRLLPTGIGLHITAGGSAWTPLGSTDLLRVVSNLVINARDAIAGTSRGGNIHVALSSTPTHVHVDVRDDGPGMDAETRARVFEPFFTTKPVGRGTGLGLTTARALVERAGGSMMLDSAVGVGTTFRIVLPRVPAR